MAVASREQRIKRRFALFDTVHTVFAPRDCLERTYLLLIKGILYDVQPETFSFGVSFFL
jgi:hypothetical protein